MHICVYYNFSPFRGKTSIEGIETYGVVLTNGLAIVICGDTCLRVWHFDEGGSPISVSGPLSQTVARPKPPRKYILIYSKILSIIIEKNIFLL